MRGDAAPPRVGLRLLLKAALASVLIVICSAAAISAAVVLKVDEVVQAYREVATGTNAPTEIPELTRADVGGARTFLLIGSDRRASDGAESDARADTMLLVRVNPDRDVITAMSIPRDLRVQIPGYGESKINASYSEGGERLVVRTIKSLFGDAPGHRFSISGVINVNFNGFQRAVNEIGGVYVDVDRKYYNPEGTGYAAIDIDAGYQRLVGSDALEYVRFRHLDNDLMRAARQQDFIRQAKAMPRFKELLQVRNAVHTVKVFGRYFTVSKNLIEPGSNVVELLKLGLFSQKKTIRSIPFEASDDGADLVTSAESLATMREEFLNPATLERAEGEDEDSSGSSSGSSGSSGSKANGSSSGSKKGRRKASAPASLPRTAPGLVDGTRTGEDTAIKVAGKVGFPFYFPTLIETSSRVLDTEQDATNVRLYTIEDDKGRKQKAYRLVYVKNSTTGQYYGVQGTSWRNPPILDNPTRSRRVGNRTLRLFYDGDRLHRVGWKTDRGAYWVTNTLTNALTNRQMQALASTVQRLSSK